MFVTTSCHTFSLGPLFSSTAGAAGSKISKTYVTFTRTTRFVQLSSTQIPRHSWRFSCFKHDESSLEYLPGEMVEVDTKQPNVKHNWVSNFRKSWRFSCFKHDESSLEYLPGEMVEVDTKQPNVKHNWVSNFRKVADAILGAEPWAVPWTAKTNLQVMLLWITSFWLVGSWIIPFVAHTTGFRKECLTYRGQALYSLLTDVVEGITGIAILKLCLSGFCPLSSDWFKFGFKGNWHFDVGLGCLMFPLVNRLSQVNLNLVPMPPPTPITVSNVEQSIVARDPIAMLLYAIVVSVCAPIWEEIVFRGFLLPSLKRYMPVWCSVLVSSIAFALAHFNIQRMLPLVFLGMVMGMVFARSRNLLPSMLLHSLWNAFVFIDLMS